MKRAIALLALVLSSSLITNQQASAAPALCKSRPVAHLLTAGLEQVLFLGQWAEKYPQASRSLDNYASLVEEGIRFARPYWAYIALRYIHTLRETIKHHNGLDVRVSGGMIVAWARLGGAT